MTLLRHSYLAFLLLPAVNIACRADDKRTKREPAGNPDPARKVHMKIRSALILSRILRRRLPSAGSQDGIGCASYSDLILKRPRSDRWEGWLYARRRMVRYAGGRKFR